MSRCFGTKEDRQREMAEALNRGVKPQTLTDEDRRQRNAHWDVVFESPEQWVEVKLQMLRNEMYIHPTVEEIMHLYELKTEGDINRAVASIIDRAWS